jgi:putative ABC transport system permease protein
MKYWPLLWAGLWRKRTRTILTLLSVVTAFVLYGLLSGVTSGFSNAIDRFADATRLRVQNKISATGSLPLSYLPQIERVDGVTSALPLSILPGYYQEPKNGVTALAIDISQLDILSSSYILSDSAIEAMRTDRTGAIVGSALLDKYGWKIGDRVTLKSAVFDTKDGADFWAFDVVGSYTVKPDSFPDDDNFFINFAYFDEARARGEGTAWMIFVRVNDVDHVASIAERIDTLFRNSPDETMTQSDKDYIRSQISRIGNINYIVNAIVGAVLFTLLFLTGNTMMQSIRERIPELAVLRTYGFSTAAITGLVVGESLSLCGIAAAVGLAIAAAAFPAAFDSMGIAPLPLEHEVLYFGAGIALVLALASALPPVWRVQRMNIVDALAGR